MMEMAFERGIPAHLPALRVVEAPGFRGLGVLVPSQCTRIVGLRPLLHEHKVFSSPEMLIMQLVNYDRSDIEDNWAITTS